MTCADFVIAGAGIVGMTTAFELRNKYPNSSICILEREDNIGVHASGRNSGVLHSGIYYPPGTLKAKVCAEGARRMKQFASENDIVVHDSGKVIVAVDEDELPVLSRLMENANENDIPAIRLDSYEVMKLEPYAAALAGIHVPITSVIDSKSVLMTLRTILMNRGVEIKLGQKVVAIDGVNKIVNCDNNQYHYGYFFNCSGAHADRLAKMMGMANDYALIPFKGIYYRLRDECNYFVRSNIYPTPDLNMPFLGVHFTRVANGDVFVGPTAIPAFGRENYGIFKGIQLSEAVPIIFKLSMLYLQGGSNFRRLVNNEVMKYNKNIFVNSARRLIPKITQDDLLPSNKVGIRPQLVNLRHNRLELDFIIEQSPSSLHVLNAISPAFTSAFSFSEYIVKQAGF